MKLFLLFLMTFTMKLGIAQNFNKKAIPLENRSSLDKLIDASKNKKLVMLGEASHGTHEYYAWRDKISRRLIKDHNFSFIAVEGDFASLYKLNRYVKNLQGAENSAREVLMHLERFPTWMWANEEVVALAEWLRKYNDNLPQKDKIGFYGMDVYDEWHSKDMVLQLLKKINKKVYNYAQNQYDCFHPHKGESWQYAHAVKGGKEDCAQATLNVVEYIRANRQQLKDLHDDEYFYLLQNAIVVHNAEAFYRESVTSEDSASWNSRAFHMHATVADLLSLYGENSKGIVWAHNTHIGDASYTNMRNFGEKNIGQLSRERLGDENVFLLGFTTNQGKVIAARNWGGTMEEMEIPQPIPRSIEAKLSKVKYESFYVIFNKNDRKDQKLKQIGNRAVGVVYNPERDRRQFVPTFVPMRYDAIVFFQHTTALHPLHK